MLSEATTFSGRSRTTAGRLLKEGGNTAFGGNQMFCQGVLLRIRAVSGRRGQCRCMREVEFDPAKFKDGTSAEPL